jgi:hypothetical protein
MLPWPRSGSGRSRVLGSTASWPSRWAARTRPTSDRCSRSSTRAPPTWWWRAELVELLQPLVVDTSDHPWGKWQDADAQASSRLPGGQSRWTGSKDLSFVTLSPDLVAEVGYEHMEGTRFRHTAQFKRWRPDREPESCTYEQLEEVVKYDLDDVLT